LVISKIYGNLKGLSASETHQLERLYRRKIGIDWFIQPELARELAHLTTVISRQIALTINRKGIIEHVIVGDAKGVMFPDLSAYRRGARRLKGLRAVRTHLGALQELTREDLTDLALLRLDGFAVLEVDETGGMHRLHVAQLLPSSGTEKWEQKIFNSVFQASMPFAEQILELEAAMDKAFATHGVKSAEERAILVHVSQTSQHEPRHEVECSIDELARLAISANVEVLDQVWQRVERYSPAYLMGKGRLQDILINGLFLGATTIIFDQELSPVQVNNIAQLMDMKVLDRTQLILDIFARRAQTSEGRIQVELAQLKYILPRLVGRGVAMSRLMGGIGGRGPGETKLEMDRRRIRDRITSLENSLKRLVTRRRQRRSHRKETGAAVASLIGYTNAGKSTLLNTLTGAGVLSEDRLFATLDTTTRRLWLAPGHEILLSDTVGFIRNMPEHLKVAFRATLEELQDSHLFLHIVDGTSPYRDEEIKSVEAVLEEMALLETPRIVVYNKMDMLADGIAPTGRDEDAVRISALNKEGAGPLIERLRQWSEKNEVYEK